MTLTHEGKGAGCTSDRSSKQAIGLSMFVAVTSWSQMARSHRLRGPAAAGVNAENEVVALWRRGMRKIESEQSNL